MRRIILHTCLIAPPLAVIAGWWLGGLWEALLLAPPLGLYAWATLVPKCSWWGPQMNTFPTRHRELLLSFDDAPDPYETPRVLELLDAGQAKALFFITGSKARQHPELVRDIVARGHAVGVQTMNYEPATFWRLLPAALRIEVATSAETLQDVLPGHELRWFRAPGGRRNHWLHPLLAELGLELTGYSAVDDGKQLHDFDMTVIRLRRDISQGGIVCLQHGQTDKAGNRTLLYLVEELILWLRGQSYKLGE